MVGCFNGCHLNVKMEKLCKRNYATKFYYEMPARYRNSFYLANAAFFDSVNWFVHRAYEVCFTNLARQIQEDDESLSRSQVARKVDDFIQMLEQCNSIIDVRFPIERTTGRVEVVRGFRANHGLYSGWRPCLGGLRIKENVTRDQMKALATLSTYKHACMGICLGGAHGGIKIEPSNYAESELQNIVQSYAVELWKKGYSHPARDIIQPDLNTSDKEMSWIASVKTPESLREAVVGKPEHLGGLENYEKATSQGAFFILDHFLHNKRVLDFVGLDPGLENKTFIIQGLGRIGSPLAKYLMRSGAQCIGVKEHDGYIYEPQGIDIEAIIEYKDKFLGIEGFGGTKPHQGDEIFTKPCDILILAAHQKSLICYVAEKVEAKVVLEAANGPVTPTSQKILVGHAKLVIPDICGCAGHSVASYLEYLLNLEDYKSQKFIQGIYKNVLESLPLAGTATGKIVSLSTAQKIVSCNMEQDVITYALEHIMGEIANNLLSIAKDYNLGMDLKTAGYIKAIQTIFESVRGREKLGQR